MQRPGTIGCTEFCRLLGLKHTCCWACFENRDIDGVDLILLPAQETGLNLDAKICCICNLKHKEITNGTKT